MSDIPPQVKLDMEKRMIARSTTAETPTMRQRLAIAAAVEGEGLPAHQSSKYLPIVDAILREMLEPSEGMDKAVTDELNNADDVPPFLEYGEVTIIQRACIRHILNETQD